jgi:hypothetical protein
MPERARVGAMRIGRLAAVICWIIIAQCAWAGPPFTTDDPEPVEYRHWEIYVASQLEKDKAGWSGTSPHFEVNYGALPNLQLHLIAPVSFSAAAHGATNFGYGSSRYRVAVASAIWAAAMRKFFFRCGYRRTLDLGPRTEAGGIGSTRGKITTIGGLPAGFCSMK